MFVRYAIVQNARTREEAEAYLPGNYHVTHETLWEPYDGATYKVLTFVIEGRDDRGWTLDGYVIPRYGSGTIGCREIDLSHPIMKEVPL